MFRTVAFSLVLVSTGFGAVPSGRYKKIVDDLHALQAQYSRFSTVFSIGQNDEGTELFAMRVSTRPHSVDKNKVGHLLVSTHHGNELGAPQFTMAFLRSLLSRYQAGKWTRGNLADTEWTVLPVLNVTGYNNNQRQEYNQDPNRDYPSPCTSHPVAGLKSIATLIQFVGTRIFSGSVTVHGYDGSFTYPWGFHTKDIETLDQNEYDQIFRKAAQVNGYKFGNGGEVVYPANGCYEDWVYWKYGMWSLLLELESGSAADIQSTVPAIETFYDQLKSSPSAKNQFLGSCTAYRGPDLRIE